MSPLTRLWTEVDVVDILSVLISERYILNNASCNFAC